MIAKPMSYSDTMSRSFTWNPTPQIITNTSSPQIETTNVTVVDYEESKIDHHTEYTNRDNQLQSSTPSVQQRRRIIFGEACKKQQTNKVDLNNNNDNENIIQPPSFVWSESDTITMLPLHFQKQLQQMRIINHDRYPIKKNDNTMITTKDQRSTFCRSESLPIMIESSPGGSRAIEKNNFCHSPISPTSNINHNGSGLLSSFFKDIDRTTTRTDGNVLCTKKNSTSSTSYDRWAMTSTTNTGSSNNTKNTLDCRLYGVYRQEIHEFVPPKDCSYKREHLKHIEELSNIIAQDYEARLPTLPSPLLRLRKHSGVYPLNSPQSILRKQKSNNKQHSHNDSNTNNKRTTTSSSSTVTAKFDEPTGVHFDPRVTVTEFIDVEQRQWYTDDELEGFKYASLCLVKQFLLQHPEALAEYNATIIDPITGLQRRKAMFSIPILGCNYNEYQNNTSCNSLLMHNNNRIGTSMNRQQQHFQNYRQNMNQLAYNEVQRILIVDPNQFILDLFTRSIQTIFPKAICVTVKSGEEAVNAIMNTTGSVSSSSATTTDTNNKTSYYDIVIVEERLLPSSERTPAIGLKNRKVPIPDPVDVTCSTGNSNKNAATTTIVRSKHHRVHSDTFSTATSTTSSSSLSLATQQQQQEQNGESKLSSSNNLVRHDFNTTSGSQVIKQIKEYYEQHVVATTVSSKNNVGTNGDQIQQQYQQQYRHCSLLIGVTTDPCQETKEFLKNGADLVWGKPPPFMNEMLRNQLVTLLVEKRNKTTKQTNK